MNQKIAQALIYGNAGLNPEQFNGLAPRFSAISGAANAQNVIDAGGTGSDNTSIWLVVWGRRHGLRHLPEGLEGRPAARGPGRDRRVRREQPRFRAYADRWQWKCGLHVKDWRYVVRICNIDVSDLVARRRRRRTRPRR
jgi:hypothetical protein